MSVFDIKLRNRQWFFQLAPVEDRSDSPLHPFFLCKEVKYTEANKVNKQVRKNNMQQLSRNECMSR
jgi:hypothetical protein